MKTFGSAKLPPPVRPMAERTEQVIGALPEQLADDKDTEPELFRTGPPSDNEVTAPRCFQCGQVPDKYRPSYDSGVLFAVAKLGQLLIDTGYSETYALDTARRLLAYCREPLVP